MTKQPICSSYLEIVLPQPMMNNKIEEMEYVLSESDINYCRRAIEDLDDDGNGLINIYDF